ncbi:hypothetical protein BDW66DRAFT_146381 [Aspergillus desertorum]
MGSSTFTNLNFSGTDLINIWTGLAVAVTVAICYMSTICQPRKPARPQIGSSLSIAGSSPRPNEPRKESRKSSKRLSILDLNVR